LKRRKMMGEKSIYSNLHHIYLVIKDMEKPVAHYQSLGIGPFHDPPVKSAELTMKGKPIPLDYFQRIELLGQMGPIKL
jgi:hypothetical protein